MLIQNIIKIFEQSFVLVIFIATTSVANNGEKFWTLKMEGTNIDASVGIGDLDRDGFLDIVVLSTTGDVIALDGFGREIWKIGLNDKLSIAPTIMDVTGDDGLEVLVLTLSGKIYCLDGLTGKVIWENSILGKIKWASMTVIASDINGDGNNEIITADQKGKLLCLDGNNKKLWEYNEPEGIGSAPAVGDLDGDGLSEIVIASEDSPLICLDHKGKVKWRFIPQGDELALGRKREVTAPVIRDINGDQIPEIITGMGYNLVAVNNKGKLIWSFPIKNRIDSGISIADTDGNGEVEIYSVDLSGTIECVTSDGKSKWAAKLGGRARRSPTIADVDGDGTVEILASGYSGKMHIFNNDGKFEESLQIKGGTNASPTIADLFDDGGLSVVVPEISGKLVVYRWKPVIENPKILWPEYRAWASRSAGDYSKNQNNGNITVDKNAYRIRRENLDANLSELKVVQEKLQNIIPLLLDSKGIIERVYYLSAAVEQGQNQFGNIDDLTPLKKRKLRDNLVELNSEYNRLFEISKQVVEEGKIIVAYTANPWAPFGGMDEIIEERTADKKINIEAFQGEFESAAMNLFNFSSTARTMRVMIEEFSGPTEVAADEVFTLRETVEVPTQDADLSADALPELNSGNLLIIPAWQGRQLWVTINTMKLTPGTWNLKIHLKSLDVEFVETTLKISIKIYDVPLPKEQQLSLCNWSGTSKPEGTFAEQIAHGNNVFTHTVPPKATFDESGEILNIDYMEHDTFMESHASKGTLLFHSLVTLSGPSKMFTVTWLKAYRNFIPLWIKHLKDLGYGYDNFAFYPIDEPGLENGKKVSIFMKWAKLVRDIDPKIRIYANPAEQITIDQVKEMSPYVDIWTPHQTQIFPQKQLEYIQSANSLLWNYECADNAKNLSPLAYYRGQAWMCWKYKHTGIGFYTYYQGSNFWFQPESGFDYAMIYEGKDIVTSKRWEAVRDGVEDFSLLYTLKKAKDAADKAGTQKELVEKAQTLLTKKASIIGDFISNQNQGKTGEDKRKIADERWKEIIEIRKEIAELLSQFQPK